jgi:23S rRNA pseudouridine955/2504/2580 synthase/23S rRNA pseudouridine1911/1915/1917 synthase
MSTTHRPVIIFENDDFIVINKPSGMLSIPDREGKTISVKSWLQEQYETIFTVHRLDKDTSGLILFAKNENAHKFLSQLFEGREIMKLYCGFIHGIPAANSGSVDAPIREHSAKNGTMVTHKKGKPSLTDYEVLESHGNYSWMQFRIHTGRTHQIRVHMKHIGHPILCDPFYGDPSPVLLSSIKRKFKLSKEEEEERPLLNRLALHAWKLSFRDEHGVEHYFEAEVPKDLRAMLQQLKKWK